MRKLILTAVMACLVTFPVLAQFRFGFGGGGAGQLLSDPAVQKALKLSDDQKKAITDAGTKMREILKEEGFEGFAKAREAFNKEVEKVRDGLTAEQKSRLMGIELQVAEKNKDAKVFTRADVQKALKLTDKQKDTAKEGQADYEKDAKEIFEDAKGDKEKMSEAIKKLGKMREDLYTKVTKTFSEDQKKSMTELQGEKVELTPFGKGKGKGKKGKTDDF